VGDLQGEPESVTKNPLERVVITGVGLVTPVGPDRESSWLALRDGRRAIRWLEPRELAGTDAVRFVAGQRYAGAPAMRRTLVRQASASRRQGAVASDADWRPSADARREYDPIVALALEAAAEAVADAGLCLPLQDPERAACVLGTSKGGMRRFSAAWRLWNEAGRSGAPRIADDWWEQFEPAAAARFTAARYDLRGAALCPVAACATGLVSIARGAELIWDGHCDIVLAGSSDASLHPLLLASFRRLRVLARTFDDPASACRPFDKSRDGFAVGEGAAVLVLERAGHALARGAVPYAEWLAAGTAADPAHLTNLDADPTSLAALIGDVLRRARVAPDEIDYVNLHGTATRQNDQCETRALKAALGASARAVSASSLKGAVGHLLGAAGSVELAATLLALRDGVVPPTANLTTPDDECDLDYTPLVPRPRRIETALKLSLGFGGHLAAAVIRTWEGGPTRAASRPSP
jgi:3-oxoacyl-[acyl-carrier-protein] synthase II